MEGVCRPTAGEARLAEARRSKACVALCSAFPVVMMRILLHFVRRARIQLSMLASSWKRFVVVVVVMTLGKMWDTCKEQKYVEKREKATAGEGGGVSRRGLGSDRIAEWDGMG